MEANNDLIGIDEDRDGFDAWDEKITDHSDNDPDDKPTQDEVDAAQAKLDEGHGQDFEKTIIAAAQSGDMNAIKSHLEANTDVNLKCKGCGGGALSHAAKFGHNKIVKLLISNMANVNDKNSRGQTPLDEAIANSHNKTAELIRKHGGKTGEELKAESIGYRG